ncbi:MAG TPA: class I SAM-dependent methyltransferase [Chryseolinea sp.]|jgi:SAM-dependent methyltransferase|nr:class I SAM-dependent methyltransferase [Chryseolinea sp.]
MANEKHKRFAWAVEVLDVKRDDYILEIGCGVGLAVEEIAERLTTGKITAIDRSPAMIAKAILRNQKNIASGKASFIKTELLGFPKEGIRFNKIFFFNINFFWTQNSITAEVSVIRSSLAKKGLVYIFYGPMLGDGFKAINNSVRRNLKNEKLRLIKTVQHKAIKCCCFIATDDFSV